MFIRIFANSAVTAIVGNLALLFVSMEWRSPNLQLSHSAMLPKVPRSVIVRRFHDDSTFVVRGPEWPPVLVRLLAQAPSEGAFQVLPRVPRQFRQIINFTARLCILKHVIEHVTQSAHFLPHVPVRVQVQCVIGVHELVVSGRSILGELWAAFGAAGPSQLQTRLSAAALAHQQLSIGRAERFTCLVLQLTLKKRLPLVQLARPLRELLPEFALLLGHLLLEQPLLLGKLAIPLFECFPELLLLLGKIDEPLRQSLLGFLLLLLPVAELSLRFNLWAFALRKPEVYAECLCCVHLTCGDA
jgi:hypothetical protein